MKTILFVVLNLFVFCLTSFGQTAKDLAIIGGFSQDKGDNCASISVIKLAIAHYGLDKVCPTVNLTVDGYNVVLQDGQSLTLSQQEIADMADLDKFKAGIGEQNEYKWAKFYYVVMAKRKMQLLKLPDIKTAAMTGKFIELSGTTDENIKYLGLEKVLLKVSGLNEIDQLPDIIITNPRHSAYCSHGYYDEKGMPVYYTLFVDNHSSFFTKLLGIRKLNNWYYSF